MSLSISNTADAYYVYVYIDPRNFEEFYYGKGKGTRKEAHLKDESDSEKVKRIRDIQKAGLHPIIKVIARDLTEREAFLVEKTLIWKLGKTLTNKSSGNFADKFRPQYSMYQDLSGFDFKNGIYYINVGEGLHRTWEDCKAYRFLSAGQDKKWSDPLRTLEVGDIVVAYLKNHGYVGIGKVSARAIPIDEFRFKKQSLRELPLKNKRMFDNHDTDKSEYVLSIEWIKSVDREEAKFSKKSGLYTTPLIKASLSEQPTTIAFIEKEFGVDLRDLSVKRI